MQAPGVTEGPGPVILGTVHNAAGSSTYRPFGVARRLFDNEAVQTAVDAALRSLPDGARGAVVAHAAGEGAALSVVGRLGDNWSVVAQAFKPYSGRLEASASVRFVW